jgi:hypothetical protein
MLQVEVELLFVSRLAYSSTLKMDATYYSETSESHGITIQMKLLCLPPSLCEIRGSEGDDCEDYSLLEYNASIFRVPETPSTLKPKLENFSKC